MVKILIHGIEDGIHDINLSVPVSEIDGIFPEFFGNILLEGTLRKLKNRFSFVGTATCTAKLICDRTLDEYEEIIKSDISVSAIADSDLFRLKKSHSDSELVDSEEYIINEDDKYLDLSNEVREQLAVRLPLKRVAPWVADKELDEIYPEIATNFVKKDIDSEAIWAPLKNLKLN
jgi:uncharacterized metal-binding protein YceD (DUF177 family)